MKKTLATAFLLLVGYALYLVFSPAPINAASYEPEPSELTGIWQANELLKQAEIHAKGSVIGPEDIDVDFQGRIYAALADGRIVRMDADGTLSDFVNTAGRPLGLHFDQTGNLWVADAVRGLLRVTPQGEIKTMATSAGGLDLGFTDDLDIAADGKVYFSDASSKYGIENYRSDILEARPWGRLLVFDPQTETVGVLLDGLYFANGVALSENEDFVLVNETGRYRITRYWLAGPKAGQSDIFIDNLPGFPDGISGNRQGLFWLAMPTPRNADLDQLHPHPRLKEIAAKLPLFLQPQPVHYGLLAALDEQGKVIAVAHDTSGTQVREVTSVQQHGNTLFIGNLSADYFATIKVDAVLNP